MLKATWFVLAGMAIVFATLILLALVMMGLNRWLGSEPRADAGAGPGSEGGRAGGTGGA